MRVTLKIAETQGLLEYMASIQLAIAERYKVLCNDNLSYEYAKSANENAIGLDDFELRKEISEFLLECVGNNHT